MRPARISLEGFGPFRQKTEVVLPETGLVHVVGQNHNTKGGSGAGKSKFVTSLAYALGYNKTPATKLQNWAAETMRVEVDMVLDDGAVLPVRRTTKSLQVGGVLGAKAGEEELQQKLRLPIALIGQLTERRQRKRGTFLSMSDEGKKTFLAQILPVEKFEAESRKAESRAQGLEEGLADLRQRVATAEGALTALRSMPGGNIAFIELQVAEATQGIAELQPRLYAGRQLVKDAIAAMQQRADARIAELKISLAGPTAELRDVEQKCAARFPAPPELIQEQQTLEAQLAEVRRRLTAAHEAERVRYAEWQQARAGKETELRAAHAAKNRRDVLSTDDQRAMASVAKLHQQKCPTCEREWPGAVERAVEVTAHHQKIVEEMLACQKLADKIPELTAALAADVFQPNQLLQQFQQAVVVLQGKITDNHRAQDDAIHQAKVHLYQKADRLRQNIAAIESEISKVSVTDENGVVADRKADVERWEQAEAHLKVQLQCAQQALAAAQAMGPRIAQAEAELAKAQGELALKQAEAQAERDYADMVGRKGFLGAIFDETLDSIANETNRILESVANVRHLSFSFRSEVTNKDGEVSARRIVPVIRIGDQEFVGGEVEDVISGGQMAAVELAVDLAVLIVVESRTGCHLGWLVLDEAFDGLGSEKETVLQVLQTFAQDRLVLAIDHNSEIGGLFEHKIVVQHRDGESWIEGMTSEADAA